MNSSSDGSVGVPPLSTALWGLLASITSPAHRDRECRLLILTTPLLLPRPDRGTNRPRRRAGLPAS